MTLKEKIISTASTGVNFCCNGDEYCKFREYADELMGRPYQDIEMANQGYWDKLHGLAMPDFMKMLRGWTPATESLPESDGTYLVTTENDCGTRKRQVSSFVRYDDIGYTWGIETSPIYTVKAWMELPEPYKEAENDRPNNAEK